MSFSNNTISISYCYYHINFLKSKLKENKKKFLFFKNHYKRINKDLHKKIKGLELKVTKFGTEFVPFEKPFLERPPVAIYFGIEPDKEYTFESLKTTALLYSDKINSLIIDFIFFSKKIKIKPKRRYRRVNCYKRLKIEENKNDEKL